MRKLLLGVLIVAFGVFALAGSANATASWTGKYTVTAKVTSAGIDVFGAFDTTVTSLSWGPTGSTEKAGNVTLSLYWSFAGGTINLSSAEFNGNLLYLKYVTSAYDFTSTIFDPNAGRDIAFSGDYLEMKLQSFPSLEIYYVDQVDDETSATSTFFDDGVAALFSQDLGVGSLSAGAVYYMSSGAGYAAAFADFTGSGALENFKLSFAYKQETSNWAVDANYSMTFANIVTVAPEFAYDDGSGWFGQFAKADIKATPKFGNVSLTLETVPEYNLAASAFSASLSAELDFSLESMVSVTTKFNMGDVVSAPNTWSAEVDTTLTPVKPLSISAIFKTDNTMAYTWNVSASYTVESGLTAGAYYDSSNNWNATLSYSASF